MQSPCVILTREVLAGRIDWPKLEDIAKNHTINLSGGFSLERQGPLNLIEVKMLKTEKLPARINEVGFIDPDELL